MEGGKKFVAQLLIVSFFNPRLHSSRVLDSSSIHRRRPSIRTDQESTLQLWSLELSKPIYFFLQ